MSILGGGPEIGFCTPSDANVYETTTAGTFDSTRARCSVNIGSISNTSSYARWSFSSSTATPNIGFMAYGARPDFGGTYTWINVVTGSSAGKLVLQVARVTNDGSFETTVSALYWNGASYVSTGTPFQINFGTAQKFDIAIDASASGGFTLYVNRATRMSATGIDLSSLATSCVFHVCAPHGSCNISEVILADESTVRMRGRTDAVTAVTAVADWSGAASDIDKVVYSDATGITSASANDVSIFTASSPTLEFNPLAVLVGARGALGTTGPTGLETALRIGSTNYFSANTVQSAGYGAKVGIWNTDPSTSAAWGATNAAAAKPGVKSIA